MISRRAVLRRASRVVGAAVISLGLLGVGSGAAAAAVDAKTVSATQWSKAVCTSFGRWESQLTKIGSPASPPSDPVGAKTAITTFLGGVSKATDKLVKDLKTAGTPNVPHGSAIAKTFIAAAQSLRDGFTKARSAADGLPTGDGASFATAAAALQSQLGAATSTLGSTLSQAERKYPAKALDQAFRTTAACTA